MSNINGHFSGEQGALLYDYVVNILPDNSNIVELGCYLGKSTDHLINNIKNSNKNITLSVVDVFDQFLTTDNCRYRNSNNGNYFYNEFISNMGDNIKYIKNIHKMTTDEASNLYEDKSLDFVYIDASHKKENVINDIKNWYPKVKKGGILAGDDWQKSDVRDGVIEILLNNNKNESNPLEQVWTDFKYKEFILKYKNQWMIIK